MQRNMTKKGRYLKLVMTLAYLLSATAQHCVCMCPACLFSSLDIPGYLTNNTLKHSPSATERDMGSNILGNLQALRHEGHSQKTRTWPCSHPLLLPFILILSPLAKLPRDKSASSVMLKYSALNLH